jgi:hypothetical protein
MVEVNAVVGCGAILGPVGVVVVGGMFRCGAFLVPAGVVVLGVVWGVFGRCQFGLEVRLVGRGLMVVSLLLLVVFCCGLRVGLTLGGVGFFAVFEVFVFLGVVWSACLGFDVGGFGHVLGSCV